jgi:ABC-type uncharacterized transport system substrate-binding protein
MRPTTHRPRPRRAWLLPFAALVALWAPAPAAAHPHVWITATATFRFDGARLVGLRQAWTFDPFFSSFLIGEFDRDGDGAFDADEQATLRDNAFASTAAYNYFTFLRLGDERLEIAGVADFAASIEGDAVRYAFTVELPEPVDPVRTPVRAAVYDETFYVDLQFDPDDPVRFEGLTGSACRFEVGQDTDHPIYFGAVYPPLVGLLCAGA